MRTDVLFKSNRHVVDACKDHVVWGPTYRRPVLVNEVGTRLKEILLQTTQALRCEIIELDVVSDHVPLLGEVDPQLGINRLVGRLKGRRWRLLRQGFPHLKPWPSVWTTSDGVATVGGAPLAVIKQEIEQQRDERCHKPRPARLSSDCRSA